MIFHQKILEVATVIRDFDLTYDSKLMINGLNDLRWVQMRNFIPEIQNFCPSNFERVIDLDNMAVDKS